MEGKGVSGGRGGDEAGASRIYGGTARRRLGREAFESAQRGGGGLRLTPQDEARCNPVKARGTAGF